MQNIVIFRGSMSLSLLFAYLVGCVPTDLTGDPIAVTPLVSRAATDAIESGSLPTSTAHPSLTTLLSATPSLTQVLFDQAAYDATQSVVQTKVAGFPRVCKEDYSRPNFSPSGLWMEELCYSEDDQDLVLTLSNSQTRSLWKLFYQDYIPPMEVIPDGGMSIVHWSGDERYAYFNSFINSSGGHCFGSNGVAESGMGLFRLDLKDGDVATLLSPSNIYWWYRFSFSPTDRRLVYAVRGRDLKILDVQTGDVIDVVHVDNFDEAGGYVWSADGLQFIYSTAMSGDQSTWFRHSVRLVDAQSGAERVLLESSDDCLAVVSWTENNHLMLEKNYNESLVEFSLNSNQVISEATMTPYP